MALAAAVFGKLPSRGDFLRVNIAHPLVRVVDRWLEEANGALVAKNLPFPESLRLLWRGEGDWLLGAFVPSHDLVGRRFPLGVARICTGESVPASVMVVAAEAYLTSSVSWLYAAERVEESKLLAELSSLADLHLNVSGAMALCEDAASREAVRAIEARLFSDHGAVYYAFQTLMLALDLAGQGQTVAVDCPLSVDVDQFYWLHCIATLRHANPVVLWVEEPEPRMLVVFGSLPSDALCVFCSDDQPDWYWPLTTERASARERAADLLRAHLSPIQNETIDGFSLRLLAAFETGAHRG